MESLIILLTLCCIEVILGIDNVFAFSMLVVKVQPSERKMTKFIALMGAFVLRIMLLFFALFLKTSEFSFSVLGKKLMISHVFFVLGGAFLVYKAVAEFFRVLAPARQESFADTSSIIWQIIFIDLVFALDSVLAAIALTSSWPIIVTSIACSLVAMYFLADVIMKNIDKSWRFKALGSLIVGLIGLFLIAQGGSWGWDDHILLYMIATVCCYEILMTYVKFKRRQIINQKSV